MVEVECITTSEFKHWYIKGTKTLHREDGPAVIQYYGNGNKANEQWYQHGKLHRLDGPAIITYYSHGNIMTETWKINDVSNNSNPNNATFKYYLENGQLSIESWAYNGMTHRINGPATIIYGRTKNIYEKWYLFNNEISSVDDVDKIPNLSYEDKIEFLLNYV